MGVSRRAFLPPEFADLYEKQEKLRVNRVKSLKRYHEKSRRFRQRNSSKRFRMKKIARLPGITVWLVDGPAIRRELDVDFTMGGHGYHYLYIPLDEVWIDQANSRGGDLWPTIWHEYFERILMRGGMHYEAAHKFACRLEILLRDGKTFVLPVGTFLQSEGFCGPAGVKIYLSYLGKNLSEKYLARLCKTTREKGTDPPDIPIAVRKLRFHIQHRGRPLKEREIRRLVRAAEADRAKRHELIANVQKQAATVKAKRPWTVAEVRRSLKKGQPVLANIQTSEEYGSGHYVLIIGFTQENFILSDPESETGYAEVPISKFMQLWYELEDGTVREGFTISS